MDNLQNQNSPLQGFEALESFISSFLLCDDHQLTILTLWVANTWCFSRFHTIPYLDIRSPESQCGKSLCLKLLELLACEPALVTAADPTTLLHRLLDKRSLSEFRKNIAEIKKNIENSNYPRFPMTFLIEDCHHSFGPSERQPIGCPSQLRRRRKCPLFPWPGGIFRRRPQGFCRQRWVACIAGFSLHPHRPSPQEML